MKRKTVLIFTAICYFAAQVVSHAVEYDEVDVAPPIPSNGAPAANPTTVYTPPKGDGKNKHLHDHDTDTEMSDMGDMGTMDHHHHNHTIVDGPIPPEEMSYWLWPEHRGLLYAHIALMTISWGFVLPVGVMLGVAQSSFHIPVQISFLTMNAISIVFAILYNSATPDFYENNAHHKIGWVIVWMLVAQTASGMIRGVARYVNGPSYSRRQEIANEAEDMFMLGGDETDDGDDIKPRPDFRRKSSDSGNGTGDSASSAPPSPHAIRRSSQNTLIDDREQNFCSFDSVRRPRNAESKMENYLAKNLQNQGWLSRISRRGAFIAKVVHGVIGRPMFCLGFIQLCTGIVTVTGIFKGDNVYNGLAHFIKGGIFFNYGIITLGRYIGVFADFGWAWNLKPPGELTGKKWKDRAPSAEFVESFFIFMYGATQSFMEHLGNHNGGIWSHKDLQHVSIAIMFFWAGLCGLLIETPAIRRCFNRTIEATLPSRTPSYQMFRNTGPYPSSQVNSAVLPPPQQSFSYNPFPGLIIFMTGIMMSMHKQESMVSTMVHMQWGYLLAAFALFRLGTYFMTFLNPPTSYLPTRPVTELLASFCLICGGIVFMASNWDTVHALEEKDVDAMFIFNLAVAASSLVMAWVIIVMAIKGWAVRRHE